MYSYILHNIDEKYYTGSFIDKTYKHRYDNTDSGFHIPYVTCQDLKKELHGEISGSFRVAILGLCQTPAEFDANELRKAMKVHSGTSLYVFLAMPFTALILVCNVALAYNLLSRSIADIPNIVFKYM